MDPASESGSAGKSLAGGVTSRTTTSTIPTAIIEPNIRQMKTNRPTFARLPARVVRRSNSSWLVPRAGARLASTAIGRGARDRLLMSIERRHPPSVAIACRLGASSEADGLHEQQDHVDRVHAEDPARLATEVRVGEQVPEQIPSVGEYEADDNRGHHDEQRHRAEQSQPPEVIEERHICHPLSGCCSALRRGPARSWATAAN